jgi:hypothetical protein
MCDYANIHQVLNSKKDFYLIFLVKHLHQVFRPETLLFQREYFLAHHKFLKHQDICAAIPFENLIPCCDDQTLKEVRKRMNYLIDLIAECMQCGNTAKQVEAEAELKQLTYYIKKSTVRGGKIYHFQTNYNRMKASILKAIYRSVTTLANTHPEMAMLIRKNLVIRPEIGIEIFKL